VGSWYSIGLFAGLGTALGVLFVGLLASVRFGLAAAAVVAAAAAIGLAFGLESWKQAVAGAVGALLGAFGAGRFVGGALQRGGTRAGTAVLVAAAALVLAGLAFVPVLGYLEALVLPALAARLRRGKRYEGLRVLAKD
jgi:hypothetical protein